MNTSIKKRTTQLVIVSMVLFMAICTSVSFAIGKSTMTDAQEWHDVQLKLEYAHVR
jgi:hypothetical protein